MNSTGIKIVNVKDGDIFYYPVMENDTYLICKYQKIRDIPLSYDSSIMIGCDAVRISTTIIVSHFATSHAMEWRYCKRNANVMDCEETVYLSFDDAKNYMINKIDRMIESYTVELLKIKDKIEELKNE